MEKAFKGKVYKCPSCGEILHSFTLICPSCGYEIQDEEDDSFVQFTKALNLLEAKRSALPSSNIQEIINLEKRICSFIQDYPVPDTKKGMYEMIILASSNFNEGALSELARYYPMSTSTQKDADWLLNRKQKKAEIEPSIVQDTSEVDRANAWLSKVKQVYQKAQLSLKKSDPDFKIIEEIYIKTIGSAAKAKKRKIAKRLTVLVLGLAMIIGIIIGQLSWIHSEEKKEQQLEERLQTTVQEVQIDINNNDFDEAREKISTIYYSLDPSSSKGRYWERQKKSLTKQVDKAEKAYQKSNK